MYTSVKNTVKTFERINLDIGLVDTRANMINISIVNITRIKMADIVLVH